MHERWPGDVRRIVEEAAAAANVHPAEVISRTRRRSVVAARRLALTAGHKFLGRTVTELAAAVGISVGAGSQLLSRPDSASLREQALLIAHRLK